MKQLVVRCRVWGPHIGGYEESFENQPTFRRTCRLHSQHNLAYSSTLKMEATCSSETSVDFQRITRRYIPEESKFSWLLASSVSDLEHITKLENKQKRMRQTDRQTNTLIYSIAKCGCKQDGTSFIYLFCCVDFVLWEYTHSWGVLATSHSVTSTCSVVLSRSKKKKERTPETLGEFSWNLILENVTMNWRAVSVLTIISKFLCFPLNICRREVCFERKFSREMR
jgi:hypothetical protein